MANEFARVLLNDGVLSIRNIDAGEEPFLYSSGMKGPGYVMVKGMVGYYLHLHFLVGSLALKVANGAPNINFVAGNATGGMIPAWILSEKLPLWLKRPVPYIYVRGSRKKGGHKELLTGASDNPNIKAGDNALVVEELVNFAETTCNSAVGLREAGYKVETAACILSYDHAKQREALKANGVKLIHLLTLDELLSEAEKTGKFPVSVVTDFRTFLTDPPAWMERRGLKRDEQGGTL